MRYIQYVSLCLIALVLGQAAALPQHPVYQQQQQQVGGERKFAEKPNAMKKVAIDDLEDISTNQIQVIYIFLFFFTDFYDFFFTNHLLISAGGWQQRLLVVQHAGYADANAAGADRRCDRT